MKFSESKQLSVERSKTFWNIFIYIIYRDGTHCAHSFLCHRKILLGDSSNCATVNELNNLVLFGCSYVLCYRFAVWSYCRFLLLLLSLLLLLLLLPSSSFHDVG